MGGTDLEHGERPASLDLGHRDHGREGEQNSPSPNTDYLHSDCHRARRTAGQRAHYCDIAPSRDGEGDSHRRRAFFGSMKDIFFAYDKSAVPVPMKSERLNRMSDFLVAHPSIKLLISVHCDERGSEEYNFTFGDSRADSVRDQLERLGINADRIRTISYGKERPFCNEETEACWQLNRRAHFSLQP